MNKTTVFIHVATVNNYQQLFDELFDEIKKSRLMMACESINVCIVGSKKLNIIESPAINVYYDPDGAYSPELSYTKGEFFTLGQLDTYANLFPENSNLLYCHLS